MQPHRHAPEVPLGGNEGPDAQHQVEPGVLDDLGEPHQIEPVLEVVLAGGGLVAVPEHVGLDAVGAAVLGFGHQLGPHRGDAARVVDGCGDEEAAAAGDDEGAAVVRHTGVGGGGDEEEEQRKQQRQQQRKEPNGGGGHGCSRAVEVVALCVRSGGGGSGINSEWQCVRVKGGRDPRERETPRRGVGAGREDESDLLGNYCTETGV